MSLPLAPSRFLSLLSIQLYPDGDFSQEMELDGWARSFQPESTEDRSLPQKNTSSSKGGSPLGSSFPVSKTPASDGDDSSYDSDADSALPLDLQDHFKRLCLRPNPRRYFGKSSSVSLLRTARDAKSKASSGESPAVYPEERRSAHRDEFWSLHPVSFPLQMFSFSIVLHVSLSGNLTACSLPSATMTSLSQIFLPALSQYTLKFWRR